MTHWEVSILLGILCSGFNNHFIDHSGSGVVFSAIVKTPVIGIVWFRLKHHFTGHCERRVIVQIIKVTLLPRLLGEWEVILNNYVFVHCDMKRYP